jgi:hypothetical protein
MLAYLAWLVLAATPLILGLVALIRADRQDIPKITRALAQWGRKSLSPDESPPALQPDDQAVTLKRIQGLDGQSPA